ncbi:MAG TPA: TerB family tellurite resistance protein [Polyangiaceae bacterium]|jgi:tellurite resistance protein|nr:TerB family tellurite resistance protein [Polyangiaceae bacterium]
MQNEARINLLARVARAAPPLAPVDAGRSGSILAMAAASYGSRPSGDATVPTGFDPLAVALFEAIVEGAYLVATSDGVFDDEERRTFEKVVVTACGGVVAPPQIAALVKDLSDQLEEDGVDRRIEMIGRAVTRKDHAREILRIAALLAYVSDDVSPVEREVLVKLAGVLAIDAGDVDLALVEAREALGRAQANS